MGKRFHLHKYLCSRSQRTPHLLVLPLQSCKILLGCYAALFRLSRLHLEFTSRDPRGSVNAGMAFSAFAKALRAVERHLFERSGSTKRYCRHFRHQRPVLGRFSTGSNSSNTAADLQSNEEHPPGEAPPPGSTGEALGLKGEWTPQSRRTGVIAVKLGMTQVWNKDGFPMAVTVLQARAATSEIVKDFFFFLVSEYISNAGGR